MKLAMRALAIMVSLYAVWFTDAPKFVSVMYTAYIVNLVFQYIMSYIDMMEFRQALKESLEKEDKNDTEVR